jgi:hypothetical protein
MAVTVTYQYPVAGTVPPTAAQVAPTTQGGANEVVASVYFDADTAETAVITHNFNLATTGATPNTGQGFPRMSFYFSGIGTAVPQIYGTVGTNIATLIKPNLANSSCTVQVYIDRPHSLTI